MQSNKAKKGIERITCTESLPVIDHTAMIGYEGSISRFGDNADWDWYLYEDENKEWVLFEADGAGCIYNFTQHRYPTSKEPTFHFYFDYAEKPQFSIKPSEFGSKPPFLAPAADKYIGPEDNGRGPIWVVRSFIPMFFAKHCKVTSTIRLEGCEKAKGEGGWGHITYHLYESSEGVQTFNGKEDYSRLLELTAKAGENLRQTERDTSLETSGVTVQAGRTLTVFKVEGEGSVSSIKISLASFHASMLRDLRIRMFWDGHTKPDVDAPVGTFFGNEYGHTEADLKTMLVGCKIKPDGYAEFYNYFPMPYWNSAVIELYNTGETDIMLKSSGIRTVPASERSYSKENTGYFVSSDYYPVTANITGKNSRIAALSGTGHMVYGTLTGYGISRGGCEGDVRVFIDDKGSPVVESDGSESWASYGWGFVTPPQCNPFSCYNGLYNANSDWSEMRLTVGDSYTFQKSIRFELEHGDQNDGMGSHSGQIFCYMLPENRETLVFSDRIDLGSEESIAAHCYQVDGTYEKSVICSAFANGINTENAFEGVVYSSFTGSSSFCVQIDPNNEGVVLMRLSSQGKGRHAANIYVDDLLVNEKEWLYPDCNPHYLWLEDEFRIPSNYTSGKSEICIRIEPLDEGAGKTWTEARYLVYSAVR